MESFGFFIQQLRSSLPTICMVVGLCLSATVAQAEDPIRDAVKLRIEKSQHVETDVEMELKKGEVVSPIAPQALDGFDGEVQEPFEPDAQEKKKILAEERRKERLMRIAAAKKAKAAAKRMAAKKRRMKKNKRVAKGRKGKVKRRPAAKGKKGKKPVRKRKATKKKKVAKKKAVKKTKGRKPAKKK